MKTTFSRRGFVSASLLASASLPLTAPSESRAGIPDEEESLLAKPEGTMPTGKIGEQEFSRLMMGGNLIGGWSHARDLSYVATLMRRYNTESKIRQTLELAEAFGINVINTWVMQDNSALFNHWKAGGKMKWISQARLDSAGGFSQIQKAIDEGAVGVHLTGDTCDRLLASGEFDHVGQSIEFMKARKCLAGVAAHSLAAIVQCEKAKLNVDFYQKTLHTHDYYSAPRVDETEPLGKNDNSWCNDPQAVVDFMAGVQKPFIAFKVLAAGAILPRAAFPYSFNSGADFVLVGMFDWQVPENANLIRRVLKIVSGPHSKRTRPWFGGRPAITS